MTDIIGPAPWSPQMVFFLMACFTIMGGFLIAWNDQKQHQTLLSFRGSIDNRIERRCWYFQFPPDSWNSRSKSPIYPWSVVLWVFVSWAVFGISNTPAAAELTSPCTLGSGNMTGPSGPQLSDCDWSDWLHYSGAQTAVVSLQLEYWWLFSIVWCVMEIHILKPWAESETKHRHSHHLLNVLSRQLLTLSPA